MAQNVVYTATLDLATLGNFVVMPTGGITRGSVQVTRLDTGTNDTTIRFPVEYSNDGGVFVAYGTPKLVALSNPTGSYIVSPIQVGGTDPFDLNAQFIKVSVSAQAISGGRARIDLLNVDQVTPGGSVAERSRAMSTELVIGGDVVRGGSGPGGGGGGGGTGSSTAPIPGGGASQ